MKKQLPESFITDRSMIEELLMYDYLEPTLLCELKKLLLLETEKEELNKLSLVPIVGGDYEAYESIEKDIEYRVREICSDISFSIYGWDEQGSREPIQILYDTTSPPEIILDKNIIITSDKKRYTNCLVFKDYIYAEGEERSYLRHKEGILHWSSKPLFFWHEEPLIEWFLEKPQQRLNSEKNIAILSKREIRKNETSERNKQIFEMYLEIKSKNLTKPDTWIANHISKTDFGKKLRITPARIRKIINEVQSEKPK
jgi:hypothetical protein